MHKLVLCLFIVKYVHYLTLKKYLFCCFSLVHDVLSDEETTETATNKTFDTDNAFNVFSTSDDDQNDLKNK